MRGRSGPPVQNNNRSIDSCSVPGGILKNDDGNILPFRCGVWRVALAMPLCALLAACAVNDFGTVSATRERADGATVLSMTGLGIWLRTRAEDAGLSIGWSRRVYVIPDGTAPPQSGASIARIGRTAGLSIDLTEGFSFTLGIEDRVVMAAIDREASRAFQLRYDAGNPAATCYRDLAAVPDALERNPCP